MGFRKQISKPNAVGVWIRKYRKENDLSVTDLQKTFDEEETLGIPILRVETTDSPMTTLTSDPIVRYFDYNEELLEAFRKHNINALSDKYEL